MFLYILESARNQKLYIGHTGDLERRLREHNETGRGWTRMYRPWTLIYSKEFPSRAQAMHEERFLKSLKSPKKVKTYIAG
jgi:putative endonuclease